MTGAIGNRRRYALDLEDYIIFPDAAHVPICPPDPGKSWITYGEITETYQDILGRHVVVMQDRAAPNVVSRVVFQTEAAVADVAKCTIDHVICLKNSRTEIAPDGRAEYVIRKSRLVEVLPCSIEMLRALNADLRERSDDGTLFDCVVCGDEARLQCGNCRTKYCGKACRAEDWRKRGHKKDCAVIAKLHIWNRKNWG